MLLSNAENELAVHPRCRILLFGYDTGIITSAIAQPDFVTQFGGERLSDAAVGGVVSSFTAGAIIGTTMVSFISGYFGRRAVIFLGTMFACLGGALQGGASVLVIMILGRTFGGIGIGLMSATIPNYCFEVAPAEWVGYGASKFSGRLSWRLPLSLQVAPAFMLTAGIYSLPEGPRNLAERGKISEACAVLERLCSNADRSNRQTINLELRQIQDVIRAERENIPFIGWKGLLFQPTLRKRVLLARSIQLFTQTSGKNVIGNHGPRIYSALGSSVTGSLFIVGLYGALAQVFNTICMAIVDKVGRRTLLIHSTIGMGASLCVEATLAKYFDPTTTSDTGALQSSVAMNFVFALFFTSVGVISWIYPREVFPAAIRARGTAVSTFINWTVNLIVAQCSPIALTRMGYLCFYFFTAFNWAAAAVIYFYYPETLGKSLKEVNEVFGDFHAISKSAGIVVTDKSV